MPRTAVCCCGACTVTVEGNPVVNAVCHCHNCKQRTGSALGWSAYFENAQVVEKAGPFTVYTLTSGRSQRWFCSGCGTTLFWKARSWPEVTGVAGGGFVEAPLPAPTMTLSNDKQCAWVGLPENWHTTFERPS